MTIILAQLSTVVHTYPRRTTPNFDGRGEAMEKKLLTVAEAADMLGLGRSKAYQLVMRGELKSIQIGRARRVPVAALDEFIQRAAAEGVGLLITKSGR